MDIKKSIISIVCILLIALAGKLGFDYLERNQNKPTIEPPEQLLKQVRVIESKLSDYKVKVESNGRVTANKRLQLSAEVGGKIVKMNSAIAVGNIIEKDEILFQLDKADYDVALASALSAVADAKLLIEQEEARAAANIKEWKRLGKGEPSNLVQRIPQLESAQARLLSAESAVERARRDLKRTEIKAPYTFTVERKYVDEQNIVLASGRLLDGYSEGELEIRLPLSLSDYTLYENRKSPIQLSARLGGVNLTWQAEFVRVIDVVDEETLSIPVIAKILPNKQQHGFKFPPIGLYLEAVLDAKKIEQNIVIPRDVLRLGDVILLVDADDKLRKQKVEVIYSDKKVAVISGIEAGYRIISTPIEAPVEGASVEVLPDS